MTDPVPHQGESEGTPVPAPQPSAPVSVTLPLIDSPAAAEASPAPSQLAPVEAAVGPSTAPQAAPLQSPLPTPPVPQPPSKRLVVAMPPALPPNPPAGLVPAIDQRTTDNDWEGDLEASAASTGVNVNLMRKIAKRESNNNPNARASTSSAAGIFQFTDGTWGDLRARYSQLGLDNRMDPRQQARLRIIGLDDEMQQRVLARAKDPCRDGASGRAHGAGARPQ